MQQDTDLEYERYKDWDFSEARPANQNPMIQKLQENARLAQSKLLDDDVASWLVKQDTDTKRHISEMIRQAIALNGVRFA